jgi:hypothetical protein
MTSHLTAFDVFQISIQRSDPLRGWVVVGKQGNFTTSLSSGLVVAAPPSPSVVYLSAPNEFLGDKLWSYKQKFKIDVSLVSTVKIYCNELRT